MPGVVGNEGRASQEADNLRLSEILQENDRLQEENDTLMRKLMKAESVYASLKFKYWETLQALKLWDMSAGAILSMNRSLKREIRKWREELLLAKGEGPMSVETDDEYEALPSFPASWREKAGTGND